MSGGGNHQGEQWGGIQYSFLPCRGMHVKNEEVDRCRTTQNDGTFKALAIKAKQI